MNFNYKTIAIRSSITAILLMLMNTLSYAQCAIGSAYLWSTLTPSTFNVPVIAASTWKQNIIDVNVVSGNTYSVGNCALVNGTNPSPAAGTSVTVRDNTSATVIAFAAGPGQICATFVAPYTGVVRAYFYNDLCVNETVFFTSGAIWGGCAAPTGLTAAAVTAVSANLSWSAAPATTPVGYEYLVTTSATPPATGTATTGTTYNPIGLTPATNYFLHVRQNCGAAGWSGWATKPFTTLVIPPCLAPSGIGVSNLTTTSATVNWDVAANSLSYDYMVDQSSGIPGLTGLNNTTGTSFPIGSLTPNTKYYIHLRTNCTGALTPTSPWALDSFTTPIECNSPVIKTYHIGTTEAVAYWEPVATAYKYEYALTQSSNPPSTGTEYAFTSIHMPALNDGKKYYIHVRSHCNSIGTISESNWSVAEFSTIGLNVQDASKGLLDLNIFPNPAKNRITVSRNKNIHSNGNIVITDITGKKVVETVISNDNIDIDIIQLSNGIYMLHYNDINYNQHIKITKQ